MDTMVLQVEPVGGRAFDLLGRRRQQEVGGQDERTKSTTANLHVGAALLLQDMPALPDRLTAQDLSRPSVVGGSFSHAITRFSPGPPIAPSLADVPLPSRQILSSSSVSTSKSAHETCLEREDVSMSGVTAPNSAGPRGESITPPAAARPIRLAEPDGHSRTSTKRRRPENDVDGPDTASLASKKRRLRHHLITSRLSHPFSFPATHILNREALAAADKRFLKVSAVMAARRLVQASPPSLAHTAPLQQQAQSHGGSFHSLASYSSLSVGLASGDRPQPTPTASQPPPRPASPGSVLRRAAILNRFRLRVVREAVLRGDSAVENVAANAALLNQAHHGLGSAWHLQASGKDQAHAGPRPFPDNESAPPTPAVASGRSGAAREIPGQSRQHPSSVSAAGSPVMVAQAVFARMVRSDLPLPASGPAGKLPAAVSELPSLSSSASTQGPSPPRLPPHLQPHPDYPHPLSRAATARAGASPPTSPQGLRPVDAATPGLRLPPSPRLRPLLQGGAGLRPLPSRHQGYEDDEYEMDDLEDAEVAFPTSEHESRYDSSDELDEVYADFSVIFGGRAAGDEEEEDEDTPQRGGAAGDEPSVPAYEDYMDELDGIPWGAR